MGRSGSGAPEVMKTHGITFSTTRILGTKPKSRQAEACPTLETLCNCFQNNTDKPLMAFGGGSLLPFGSPLAPASWPASRHDVEKIYQLHQSQQHSDCLPIGWLIASNGAEVNPMAVKTFAITVAIAIAASG